jgi:hypothetical protein
MATALSPQGSRLGFARARNALRFARARNALRWHGYTHPSDERGSLAEQRTNGSPFAIFSAFASGLALMISTGSLLASVAYLAHLIDTSWQLF